ncbi:hypothetical protein BO82DRAFT_279882, partial [Aspergillus uvarum CBS 121591]
NIKLFNRKDKHNYKLFKLNIYIKLIIDGNYYSIRLEQVFYIYSRLYKQAV